MYSLFSVDVDVSVFFIVMLQPCYCNIFSLFLPAGLARLFCGKESLVMIYVSKVFSYKLEHLQES